MFNSLAPGIALAGNIIQDSNQDRRDAEARAWQEKMVDEANMYNSPVAQRNRMIAAGFNPNLLVGQPMEGASSAPSPGQGSRPASFDDVASTLIQLYQGLSSAEVNKAQAEALQSSKHKTDVESDLLIRGESRNMDTHLYNKGLRPVQEQRAENAETRAQNEDRRAEEENERKNLDSYMSKERFDFWRKYAEEDKYLDRRAKDDVHNLSFEQYRKAEREAQLLIDTFDEHVDLEKVSLEQARAELDSMFEGLARNAIFRHYVFKGDDGHWTILRGYEDYVMDLLQDVNGLNTVGDSVVRGFGSAYRKIRKLIKYIK